MRLCSQAPRRGGVVGLIAACVAATLVGCAPVKPGTTALGGEELKPLADKMAMSLRSDPQVQQAIRERGPMAVVVQPVENWMTAEVLPRGAADAFTARIRTLLARAAPDDFVWVMNRDAWKRIRRAELDGGPQPDAINPRYALTAKFYSLTTEDSKKRASTYLCLYELTDLETRIVLWTEKFEVRKRIVKGFLD